MRGVRRFSVSRLWTVTSEKLPARNRAGPADHSLPFNSKLTSIALLSSPSSAGVVFRHPVFLVTFLLALIGWFVAFIGMCVAESDLSEYTPSG